MGVDWRDDTYRLLFRKITGGTEYHDDSIILQLDGAGMERHCQLWNGIVNLTTAKSVLKNELHGGAVAGGGEGISRGSDNAIPSWLGRKDWKQSRKLSQEASG